jgi:hypothetical protein
MKISRSNILPILTLTLLISGYSIFWYVHASQIEKGLVSYLAKQTSIQYDSIEKSGFPTSINLTVKKPKFAVDLEIDELQIVEFQDNEFQDESLNTSINASLEGAISARFAVFGGLKELRYEGKTNLEIPQDESDLKNTMHFDATLFAKNDSEFLLSKEALKACKEEDLSNLWKDLNLESAAFEITNFTIKQNTSDKALTSFDKGSIALQSKAQSDKQNSFEIVAEIVGLNNRDTSPLIDQLYAEQGKTNSKVVLHISLPSKNDLKTFFKTPVKSFFTSKVPEIAIDLKELDSTNNFGLVRAQGALSIQEDDEMNASLTSTFSLQGKQTKNYHSALVRLIHALGENNSTITPRTKLQKDLLQIISENSDEVARLIPQFDQFGTIEFSKDLKFEFNKNSMHTKFVLNKLMLNSELYGINIHGLLEGTPYNGAYTLDIYSYKALIIDAISYYNRLTKLLNKLAKTPFNTLSNELQDKILHTLLQISDAPNNGDAKDLSITLRYENGQITIGTLPLATFILETADTVQEIMNQVRPQESLQESPDGAAQSQPLPFIPH